MSSPETKEDTKEETKSPPKMVTREEVTEILKSAPKIEMDGHLLYFDMTEADEFFLEKAKEELRETPEIIAESYKKLRELLTGKLREGGNRSWLTNIFFAARVNGRYYTRAVISVQTTI